MKIISQAALYATVALSSLSAASSSGSGEDLSPAKSPHLLGRGAFAVPPTPQNSPASHVATPASSALGLTPICVDYAKVGAGRGSFIPLLGGAGTSEVPAASSSSGSSVERSLLGSFDAVASSKSSPYSLRPRTFTDYAALNSGKR